MLIIVTTVVVFTGSEGFGDLWWLRLMELVLLLVYRYISLKIVTLLLWWFWCKCAGVDVMIRSGVDEWCGVTDDDDGNS